MLNYWLCIILDDDTLLSFQARKCWSISKLIKPNLASPGIATALFLWILRSCLKSSLWSDAQYICIVVAHCFTLFKTFNELLGFVDTADSCHNCISTIVF